MVSDENKSLQGKQGRRALSRRGRSKASNFREKFVVALVGMPSSPDVPSSSSIMAPKVLDISVSPGDPVASETRAKCPQDPIALLLISSPEPGAKGID